MEKYRRVDKKDKNQPQNKDEIRVRAGDNPIFPYLSYAHRHFSEGSSTVIIKATGNAISKAVQVVELIKRRFEGLHQQNEITSLEVEDVYEPIEEGLDTVTRTRRLTMLVCTLSHEALDMNHYGYQEPLPKEEVQRYQPAPQRGAPRQYRSGPRDNYYRRGGYYRGGRGGGLGPRDYEQGPRYRGGRGYGYGGGNRNYHQNRHEDDFAEDYDEEFEDYKPRGRGGYRGGRGGYRPRGQEEFKEGFRPYRGGRQDPGEKRYYNDDKRGQYDNRQDRYYDRNRGGDGGYQGGRGGPRGRAQGYRRGGQVQRYNYN